MPGHKGNELNQAIKLLKRTALEQKRRERQRFGGYCSTIAKKIMRSI